MKTMVGEPEVAALNKVARNDTIFRSTSPTMTRFSETLSPISTGSELRFEVLRDVHVVASMPTRSVSLSRRMLLDTSQHISFESHIRGLNPCLAYLGPVVRNKIVRALELVHESSPEKTFLRSVAVVGMMAELRMDCDALLAGALKGALVADEDIMLNAGEEALAILRENASVARVIELTRNLDARVPNDPVAVRQLVLTSSSDWRAVALELVDAATRWKFFPDDDSFAPVKKSFAERILSLYAPLANQLGIWSLQSELEELAFEYLHPAECDELRRLVGERLEECAVLLERTKQQVEIALRKSKQVRTVVSSVVIKGRIKGLYSIFKKMQRSKKSFAEIYDMIALRIIVQPRVSGLQLDTERILEKECCYRVLDVIHAGWAQHGDGSRFKDFLARPKANGYESLHTTVVVGDKSLISNGSSSSSSSGTCSEMPLEMQIRTTRMHRFAEFGRAAHWLYKEHSYNDFGLGAGSDEDESAMPFSPRDEFSFGGKDFLKLDAVGLDKDVFDVTDHFDTHADYITAANQALRRKHIVVLSKGTLHYVRTGATLEEFAVQRLNLTPREIELLTVNGQQVPVDHTLQMSDIVGFESLSPPLSSSVPTRMGAFW